MTKVFLPSLRYLVSLGVLLGAWHGAVVGFNIPPFLLPAPSDVLRTLFAEWPSFLAGARPTFVNMLVGGTLGISLGFGLGAMCAYFNKVRWLIEPYLTIFQSFPREALFPLIIVWLGFGCAPKMVNAALLSFFPMAIVTLHSLSDTRDEYLRLFQSWDASRLQQFVYCRLPAAVPSLVGGLRVAIPLASIGAVLGEFLGGNEGLGYLIVSSGSTFRVDRVFAAIIVLALGGTSVIGALDLFRFAILRRYYQR